MNIIITGASKGIGYQLVKRFCEVSDTNIIALARSYELLTKLKAECFNEYNKKITIFEYDLSKQQDSEFLAEVSRWSSIDILVNNAGALINKPFLDLTLQDWEHIFKVNVFGIAQLVNALHPKLKASSHAHIVNIGSMGGVERSSKFPGLSAYSSSKAALANLTECLAEEFKEDGISCNCLCLGAVNTEMLRTAFPGYEANVEVDQMAKFICDFAVNTGKLFNGKIIPVSSSTP